MDEWQAMAASLAAAIDVEPTEQRVERSSKAAKTSTLAWTQRRLHIFYCVVLRQVFEWCALSDFFLSDDFFYDYCGKKICDYALTSGAFTKPSKPYSVPIAVCKCWLREVQRRVRAHPLRMDYDMRVLKHEGIMHGADIGGVNLAGDTVVFPSLCCWGRKMHAMYKQEGGESAVQAAHRGVELCLTRKHALLFEKMLNFRRSETLGKITGVGSVTDKCVIQFRELQVIGNGVLDYYALKDMQGTVRVQECEKGIVFYTPKQHMMSWQGLKCLQATSTMRNEIWDLSNTSEEESVQMFYNANNPVAQFPLS